MLTSTKQQSKNNFTDMNWVFAGTIFDSTLEQRYLRLYRKLSTMYMQGLIIWLKWALEMVN